VFGYEFLKTILHFGLKLPTSGLILTIFGEKIDKNRKIDKNVKLNILTPKRHTLGAKHVY